MEDWLYNILFWGVFVGGGTIFVAFCAIMGVKQYKWDTANPKAFDHSSNEADHSTVTVNATVVDQSCCVKTIGIKMPKTIKEFVLTFKTESGNIIRLNVPEEMYDGFDKNQTGILTIVDGQLYGFELTDEVSSKI